MGADPHLEMWLECLFRTGSSQSASYPKLFSNSCIPALPTGASCTVLGCQGSACPSLTLADPLFGNSCNGNRTQSGSAGAGEHRGDRQCHSGLPELRVLQGEGSFPRSSHTSLALSAPWSPRHLLPVQKNLFQCESLALSETSTQQPQHFSPLFYFYWSSSESKHQHFSLLLRAERAFCNEHTARAGRVLALGYTLTSTHFWGAPAAPTAAWRCFLPYCRAGQEYSSSTGSWEMLFPQQTLWNNLSPSYPGVCLAQTKPSQFPWGFRDTAQL